MNTIIKLICRICLLAVLLNVAIANGAILSARGSPAQKTILAGADNIVVIRWQIGTSADHADGVISSSATLTDPATSTLLGTIGGTLSKSGNGAFAFSETFTFPAAQVKAWQQAGVKRVVLQRTFNDLIATTFATGQITLTISSSTLSATRDAAGDLNIQRLRIGFDEAQTAVKVIAINTALQPILTINYAGTGMLEGKWQVAEPGSTEGLPLYRTLSMVRQPLMKAQESHLQGPVLPTSRIGKYLLRFCVTARALDDISPISGDVACPVAEQTVTTAYQVTGSERAVDAIVIKSPQQESVNNHSLFSWVPVNDAAMYKLDVFEKQNEEQWFVTGILLPKEKIQTALSELMQQNLKEGGVYVWQVSALDANGGLLAQSEQFVFRYQP